MHNDFVRFSGLWPAETVITPGDLRRFDVAQYQALDGDAGGTWSPATPITIGGSGLVLTGGSSFGHHIYGGVLTLSGGRLKLGASIYPRFTTVVSRTINWPLYARGFATTAGTRVFASLGLSSFAVPVPARQMHNSGTLASANVQFQVGKQHTLSPATLPQAQLVRSDYAAWIANTWSRLSNPIVGALVHPTVPNGYAYACTSSFGTTGSSEPTWPTTINASVVDGTVTWVCTGYWGPASSWTGGHAYSVGNVVSPTANNGLVYVCTSVSGTGTSAAAQPQWPLTVGATVTDNPGGNQVVWTCIGTPRAAAWTPMTSYRQNVFVRATPDNGLWYYQKLSPGTSGGSPPTWLTAVNSITVDNTVAWVCVGSNPIGAGSMQPPSSISAFSPDTYYNGGAIQTLTVPCSGATTVDTADYSYSVFLYDEAGFGAYLPSVGTWAPGNGYTVGVNIQPSPANGFWYQVFSVAGSGISGATQPTWPIILGATVIDNPGANQIVWKCMGSANPTQNLFASVALSFTSIADMRPE